jgi:hypothetical protein
MSVLARFYNEVGNDVKLHTVEITCEAWSQPIVLVRDYVDHSLITEDDRHIKALASGMQVALPKRDASGKQPITFAIDGVRTEAVELLKQAINSRKAVQLTYRAYLASDKTAPAERPYKFNVTTYRARNTVIELTGEIFDVIDMRYPRDVFNSVNAPMLQFMT